MHNKQTRKKKIEAVVTGFKRSLCQRKNQKYLQI